MPKLLDIIGGALQYAIPKRRVKVVKEPQPPREAICADMLTVYEWLLKYQNQTPFFCLMLQEDFESSFFLDDNNEPVIFKDWEIVEQERKEMDDPRVWILEVEGIPN